MIEKSEIVEAIIELLFFNAELKLYAVIDGAACEDLRFKLHEFKPQYHCLWSGELTTDIEETAPYVVKLKQDHAFTHWLISNAWGLHWNIFIASKLDIDEVRKGLKKLQFVRMPSGDTQLFRFYDPRVSELFMQVISEEQQSDFFKSFSRIYFKNNYQTSLSEYAYDAGTSSLVSKVHTFQSKEEKIAQSDECL